MRTNKNTLDYYFTLQARPQLGEAELKYRGLHVWNIHAAEKVVKVSSFNFTQVC